MRRSNPAKALSEASGLNEPDTGPETGSKDAQQQRGFFAAVDEYVSEPEEEETSAAILDQEEYQRYKTMEELYDEDKVFRLGASEISDRRSDRERQRKLRLEAERTAEAERKRRQEGFEKREQEEASIRRAQILAAEEHLRQADIKREEKRQARLERDRYASRATQRHELRLSEIKTRAEKRESSREDTKRRLEREEREAKEKEREGEREKNEGTLWERIKWVMRPQRQEPIGLAVETDEEEAEQKEYERFLQKQKENEAESKRVREEEIEKAVRERLSKFGFQEQQIEAMLDQNKAGNEVPVLPKSHVPEVARQAEQNRSARQTQIQGVARQAEQIRLANLPQRQELLQQQQQQHQEQLKDQPTQTGRAELSLNPQPTYVKVHQGYLSKKTLDFYQIPYELDRVSPRTRAHIE